MVGAQQSLTKQAMYTITIRELYKFSLHSKENKSNLRQITTMFVNVYFYIKFNLILHNLTNVIRA